MLKVKILYLDMLYMIPALPLSTTEGMSIGEYRHKKPSSSTDFDRECLRQFTFQKMTIYKTAGGAG